MAFRSALWVTVLFGWSVAAQATPIAAGSLISFAGGAIYNDSGIVFLLGGKASIVADTSTGSFATAFGDGCSQCATFYSFSYANFSSPTTIYSAKLDGIATGLQLTSLQQVQVTPTSLELIGTGVLTLTGYDPTPGTFYLSSQAKENAKVSFSATSMAGAVVPEPASMMLLGAGLLGAALIRRRK